MSTGTSGVLTMMINHESLGQESLYDRAKVELYGKHCKSGSCSIEITERKFKNKVEELHDSELAVEYAERDKLMKKLTEREHANTKMKRAIHAQDKAISILCQMLVKIKQEGRMTPEEEENLNAFPDNIPLCLCIPDT